MSYHADKLFFFSGVLMVIAALMLPGVQPVLCLVGGWLLGTATSMWLFP